MLKQRSKIMLQDYYDIKRMLNLSLKIRLYFSTLQGLIDRNQTNEINKQQVIDSYLIKILQKHSEQQKIYYLLFVMKGLQRYYNDGDDMNDDDKKISSNINNIETSCNIMVYSFKLSYWMSCKFKLDKFKRTVLIINKKKNFTINLKLYLVRNSKQNHYSIVLDTINKEIPYQYQKITLQFKPQIYQVIYQELFEVIADYNLQNILQMVKEASQQGQLSDRQYDIVDKSLVFLTSQHITNYLSYKSQILQRLQVGGFSFKSIYYKQQGGQEIKIERSCKIDKIFKLQCLMKGDRQDLKRQFLWCINNIYRYRIQSNILQQYSKRYRAIYDKYLINNKIYEQISIKQESNTQRQQIYFSKGIENILTGNNLQFIMVKVKQTDNIQYNKLVIVISLVLGKDINLQIAIAFLLEFRNMLYRKQSIQPIKIQQNQDQFYTIVNKDQFNIQQDLQEQQDKEISPDLIKKQKSSYNQNYLIHRYINTFIHMTNQEKQQKKLKQHYFKNVWGRQNKGGVICINQAMNIQQRNVVKKIVSSLGSNLYKIVKSGNFMNCSLPLGIFKKASHLQLIGNNLAYAPILFDRFHNQINIDVIQRFKYAILFNISVSNLGISLEKPFNPILGQTLQCRIGGCPVYLEQISHHPPISCFFFEGRGYKIHGCINPKISIGLNSLSCWSQNPSYIQFDDGSKIILSFGKMIMNGFIFGDRQFNYQDRTYLYDMKNHLFCIMQFGAKKKGLPKNDATDFVHGKICKTNPDFLQKFLSKSQLYPEKCDIQFEASLFQGIWNQKIIFDDKQYFDFSVQLPYMMQKQEYALPSNYSNRKDLKYYHEDNLKMAQQQKQLLQQIQRRDRKMRQKYNK